MVFWKTVLCTSGASNLSCSLLERRQCQIPYGHEDLGEPAQLFGRTRAWSYQVSPPAQFFLFIRQSTYLAKSTRFWMSKIATLEVWLRFNVNHRCISSGVFKSSGASAYKGCWESQKEEVPHKRGKAVVPQTFVMVGTIDKHYWLLIREYIALCTAQRRKGWVKGEGDTGCLNFVSLLHIKWY